MNLKMSYFRLIRIALLSALTFAAQGAWAGLKFQRQDTSHVSQAGQVISKSEAADAARRAYGGRVIKVEKVEQGGRVIYRVKLHLDGGRIKYVQVDGQSGKVI